MTPILAEYAAFCYFDTAHDRSGINRKIRTAVECGPDSFESVLGGAGLLGFVEFFQFAGFAGELVEFG